MARLTKEQWEAARKRWEGDPGLTYESLANEIGVSKTAVIGYSKRNGWSRGNVSDVTNVSKNVSGNISKGNKKKHQETVKKELKLVPVAELVPHEEKREPGRPSLYREEFEEQVYKLCLLGATDAELADFFMVTEQTINNWKHDYPVFFESMRRGKIMADANVSERLYQRCMGYSHEAEKIFNDKGSIVRADYTEHYPPDTAAIKLWLLNRRPKDWKDKVEVKEEININVFPPKEELDAIYNKALAEAAEMEAKLVGRRERLGIMIEHNDIDGD